MQMISSAISVMVAYVYEQVHERHWQWFLLLYSFIEPTQICETHAKKKGCFRYRLLLK